MFSNVHNYEEDVLFKTVEKGVVELKYAHRKLYQGSHILKCTFLSIGLHRIAELQEYANSIKQNEAGEELKEDELENIGVVVRQAGKNINVGQNRSSIDYALEPWIEQASLDRLRKELP